MKTLLYVLALTNYCFCAANICDARVPAPITRDFCSGRPFDIIKHKAALPKNVRSALSRAFQESELSIADVGDDFQRSDFVDVKPGKKPLPNRRLLFAFRTADHFVVYYESSNMGLGANALVFSTRGDKAIMQWGGVEPNYDRLAKTPTELMHRICKDQLISDRKFFW